MLLYISAWAISALLVQTVMGNAKASECGTSNRYRFPRFSFYLLPNLSYFEPSGSGESAGKTLYDYDFHRSCKNMFG